MSTLGRHTLYFRDMLAVIIIHHMPDSAEKRGIERSLKYKRSILRYIITYREDSSLYKSAQSNLKTLVANYSLIGRVINIADDILYFAYKCIVSEGIRVAEMGDDWLIVEYIDQDILFKINSVINKKYLMILTETR